MLDLRADQVHLIFFLAMLPIAIWVMLSDLRSMRIPNRAVAATVLIFAVAGFGALGIALLTVSFQAIKAAWMSPVKSLRSE